MAKAINENENNSSRLNSKMKDTNRKWNWNKFLKQVFLLLFVMLIVVSGIRLYYYYISSETTSAQSRDFDTDEVMSINNQKILMNEFLLYAADVYQGYHLQNEADWDMEVTDAGNVITTFEEQVKGTICEQIRMTKVLCMKAQEEGIKLTEDEKKILLENANTYYSNLVEANAVNETLTVNLIAAFYEENALAQKVYNNIIESYKEGSNAKSSLDNGDSISDLSEKETYFIDVYHDLEEKYDENYNYYTSINWDLLKQLSFSELSKED